MKPEDLYDAMRFVRSEFLEESEMQDKSKKNLPRRALLIAAAVAVVGVVSATAVSWSLRRAARANIGIEKPLPGWTEYEVEGEPETVTEAKPQPPKPERVEHDYKPEMWQDAVTLDSSICSGDTVVAFLRVGGITPEVAASLAKTPQERMARDDDDEYQWDIGGISIPSDQLGEDDIGGIGITHVSYDEATETALVRVEIDQVQNLKEIPFGLKLINGLKNVTFYEDVIIPITPTDGLHTEIDFPLPRGDYRGDMRGVSASVYANYVEINFTFTPFSEVAEPDELGEGEDIHHPDGTVENYARDAQRDYLMSLFDRPDEALDDVRLVDHDGNEIQIVGMETNYSRLYGNGWNSSQNSFPYDYIEGGEYSCRYEPIQAFDLSQIASIIIGGVNYPLS